MMNKPFLQVNNLLCRFGDFTAVNKISFSLEEKESFVLLGESGCGKTTLLRAIAGLETPVSGTIHHLDTCFFDSQTNLPGNKRKVGFIFQDYVVFPHLKVRDNILFAVKHKKKETLQYMLDLFKLNGQENKMPHQLSGGQLQRVSIARTLASAPDLILMDEPFSNLDAQLSRSLGSEIREIFKREGVSSILVTHDCEEAFSFADRLAIMKDGQLMQTDTPENVYLRPDNTDVATFFGPCQLIEGEARGSSAQCCLGNVPLMKVHRCKVRLLLRPENLRMKQCSAGLFEVRNIRFLGDKKEVMAVRDKLKLLINTSNNENISIGDRVNISIKEAVPAYRV